MSNRDSSQPRDEQLDAEGKIDVDLDEDLTLTDTRPSYSPLEHAGAFSGEMALADSLDAWTADRLRRSSLPPSTPPMTVALIASEAPVTDDAVRADAGEEGDDVLRLVQNARPAPVSDLVSEMTDRFALGDFSGALRAAELLLGQQGDHALATHYAHESRVKLDAMYVAKLEAKGRVPCLQLPTSELRWLGLDSNAGALLAEMDGELDYEAVVARCGMPRLTALRVLAELLDAAVIRLV